MSKKKIPIQVDDTLVTQHGTLRPSTTDDPVEARARIFCNRWGLTGSRVTMLVEVRKLLKYALTREEDDDDPVGDPTPAGDTGDGKPDPSLF